MVLRLARASLREALLFSVTQETSVQLFPEYLKTAGWGTSTVSEQWERPLYSFCICRVPLLLLKMIPGPKRSSAYIEPGGYYEKQALEWIAGRSDQVYQADCMPA